MAQETKEIVIIRHCSGEPWHRAEIPGDHIALDVDQAIALIDAGVAQSKEDWLLSNDEKPVKKKRKKKAASNDGESANSGNDDTSGSDDETEDESGADDGAGDVSDTGEVQS